LQAFDLFPNTKLTFGKGAFNVLIQKMNQTDSFWLVDKIHFGKCFLDNAIFIESGENCKSIDFYTYIQNELCRRNINRNTSLIVVGGGTLLDLGGFIASTYNRGLDLHLVPTTLLSMVDASIGGKNGINFSLKKNFLGTTYFPITLTVDLDFLSTLSPKQIDEGKIEIQKLGLVRNSELFFSPTDFLEAILLKNQIVKEDPYDQGMRKILNFGHTIAHAVESVSNYAISHGEAVRLGLIAESFISYLEGFLKKDSFNLIYQTLGTFKWNFAQNKLIEAMKHDKKNMRDEIHFVLIREIGHVFSLNNFTKAVAIDTITMALSWMEEHASF
jgi:3-dehydroquinate synthetase